MKYFIDTEFIESGSDKPIQLISISIISEDNRKYYAISNKFNILDANNFVRDKVIPLLDPKIKRKSLLTISKEIIEFISGDNLEFWGYYADYDWVVFCQIFGSMMNLPKGFPMYCNDIKQLCKSKGNPKLLKQESNEHNAFSDAKWNKLMYEKLMEL